VKEEKPKRSWSAYIGVGLIVVSYAAALVNVFRIEKEQTWTDKKVIRLCHWQLETGFRESFNWVIKEYEKIHPDVKVIQLPIAAPVYKQFLVTQLVGGTAPDIIEVGQLGDATDQSKVSRYFYGLAEYLTQPNPYNANNEMKDVPWVHTFKHELEWNWDASNLDYFSIGITGVSARLVYNKTLTKKITGKESPPQNFREFLAFCKQVKHYSDSTGTKIYPIASARYQYEDLANRFSSALSPTFGNDVYDRECDAAADPIEQLMAWLEKRYSFDDDRVRACNEVAREILPFMEPGFMAKDRQDAGFSFAQQKSLIITAGSWDMNSMVTQARASGFEVGVMPLPVPDPGDPVYGKYASGAGGEGKDFNMPMGVCRFSPHPDVAIDFLRFYSSKEISEGFCKRCGWMCSVRGTHDTDFIQGFEPNYVGYSFAGEGLRFGNETEILRNQLKWDFNLGKISFDDFIKDYNGKFLPIAMKDINSYMEFSRNSFPSAAQMLSNLSLRLKFAADQKEKSRLKARLANAAESYASFRVGIQDYTHQFLRVLDSTRNERVDAMKKELQCKIFIDEFSNVPSQKVTHVSQKNIP
jgi:raffinose/stachyose/melibiose transport system substrate-binding protein